MSYSFFVRTPWEASNACCWLKGRHVDQNISTVDLIFISGEQPKQKGFSLSCALAAPTYSWAGPSRWWGLHGRDGNGEAGGPAEEWNQHTAFLRISQLCEGRPIASLFGCCCQSCDRSEHISKVLLKQSEGMTSASCFKPLKNPWWL